MEIAFAQVLRGGTPAAQQIFGLGYLAQHPLVVHLQVLTFNHDVLLERT